VIGFDEISERYTGFGDGPLKLGIPHHFFVSESFAAINVTDVSFCVTYNLVTCCIYSLLSNCCGHC